MDSKFITGADIFTCQQCGECCKGFGGTYVTTRDIALISAYIKADPDNFVDRYCEKSGSRYVLACGPDRYCIFFDTERQCTIHPVKPYMCNAWPFIQAVFYHPENWNIMAGSCPGMKKNIPEEMLQKIIPLEKEKLDQSVLK